MGLYAFNVINYLHCSYNICWTSTSNHYFYFIFIFIDIPKCTTDNGFKLLHTSCISFRDWSFVLSRFQTVSVRNTVANVHELYIIVFKLIGNRVWFFPSLFFALCGAICFASLLFFFENMLVFFSLKCFQNIFFCPCQRQKMFFFHKQKSSQNPWFLPTVQMDSNSVYFVTH